MAATNGPGVRVLKQYQTEDGQTYVVLSTGETVSTDSDEYRDYYDQGILYGEDEKGQIHLQENAHDTLQQYQQLTQNNSFENYMKGYFEDEMTGTIARGLGQSMEKFWEVNPSFKQNYDREMQKQFTDQFISGNPRTEGEERGTYLDRITGQLPENVRGFIIEAGNPNTETTYWNDFQRGAYYLKNDLLDSTQGLFDDIRADKSLSRFEQTDQLNALAENPFMAKSINQLGLLGPLAVPAKVIQSAYRPDYSFEDAIAGRKNSASLVEDLVTDPLTYFTGPVTKGISKVTETLSGIDKMNALRLAAEESTRLIPGNTRRAERALQEANEWSDNWYQNPEFKSRLESIQEEMSNSYNTSMQRPGISEQHRQGLLEEQSRGNKFWNQLGRNVEDRNYQSMFQSDQSKIDRLLEGKPHLHQGNSGVSYGEFSRPDQYSPMGTNGTQNFVNRHMNSERISSTGVHEGNHGIMTPRMIGEVQPAPRLNAFFRTPFREALEAKTVDSYYSDPMEIYARIQEFRRFNKIQPGQTVSPIETEVMQEVSKRGSQINRPFLEAFNPATMSHLLNKLPAVGAGTAIPAWLLSQEIDQ